MNAIYRLAKVILKQDCIVLPLFVLNYLVFHHGVPNVSSL